MYKLYTKLVKKNNILIKNITFSKKSVILQIILRLKGKMIGALHRL